MLGGDISSKQAPIIAFNIDNLLFNEAKEEETFLEKFKGLFKFTSQKYTLENVNNMFVNQVNSIWIRHPYSIYFITFSSYLDDLFTILDKKLVSYTSLVKLSEWEEVRERCMLEYMYYFDNDEELLSYVSTKNALHISKLPLIIK